MVDPSGEITLWGVAVVAPHAGMGHLDVFPTEEEADEHLTEARVKAEERDYEVWTDKQEVTVEINATVEDPDV